MLGERNRKREEERGKNKTVGSVNSFHLDKNLMGSVTKNISASQVGKLRHGKFSEFFQAHMLIRRCSGPDPQLLTSILPSAPFPVHWSPVTPWPASPGGLSEMQTLQPPPKTC